ncbi:MAG: AtpZ/AtpI family protein, partial [Desulfosarcina sp.]|nr:AtpZ/AtpI family protein [Desulfobacterales bacterium]
YQQGYQLMKGKVHHCQHGIGLGKLDRWLGTKGIFVTVFIILGVIGGANTAYRQILELTETGKEKEPDKENGND